MLSVCVCVILVLSVRVCACVDSHNVRVSVCARTCVCVCMGPPVHQAAQCVFSRPGGMWCRFEEVQITELNEEHQSPSLDHKPNTTSID